MAATSPLENLTMTAIDRPAGSAVACEWDGRHHFLDATAHRYGALVGLRCPAEMVAVASILESTIRIRGETVPAKIAWSADRLGRTGGLARVDPDCTFSVHDLKGPVVDVARRALGLATPACEEPVVTIIDAVFLDRVRRALDRRGFDDRPDWAQLAALHPLVGNTEMTARELLGRRASFESTHSWSLLRRCVSRQASDMALIAPGLDSAVAGWLDDGSFARWMLAGLGGIEISRAEVLERVGSEVADRLSRALGPV